MKTITVTLKTFEELKETLIANEYHFNDEGFIA
jgi:hypothetical protein